MKYSGVNRIEGFFPMIVNQPTNSPQLSQNELDCHKVFLLLRLRRHKVPAARVSGGQNDRRLFVSIFGRLCSCLYTIRIRPGQSHSSKFSLLCRNVGL